MLRYIGRRLLQGAVTIFGAITLSFLLVRLSGNPAAILLGPEATPADVARLSSELGFDRPLPVQYVQFLADAAGGDLGQSLKQGLPAMDLVLMRLPATLQLALTSFIAGTLLAFVLVMMIQLSGSKWLRESVLWFATARQAVPSFWLGLILVMLFAVQWDMLPALGNRGPSSLVLPAVTIATLELALYIRLLNNGFNDQLRQDYVRTAHAKGQRRSVVILRHMLPNAVLPIVTVAGLNLGALLGGTIVVELVFNWPGIGQLLMTSISGRDYTVVQAVILVVAVAFVLVNLLVDILYAALDPRVRLS